MVQGKRGEDQEFRASDHLYYRCATEDVVGDRLLPARISYANTSVNWSKYSKPWDVIFDHPEYGIARFIVRDLPVELPRDVPVGAKAPLAHSFFPSHVPEKENYAHSEIWTWRDGNRMPKAKLPELVKKEFRQIMSDRSLVLHQPRV